MSVERAKEILNRIHAEFCFLNEQSKVHALARIITPFARGLLGFTTRVPLWIFRANRPRAGKDYLAVMTILTYEGIAAEDSPIGRDQEETGKRIMSAPRERPAFHALLKLPGASRRPSPDASHHQRADHRKAPGNQRGVERPLAFPTRWNFRYRAT